MFSEEFYPTPSEVIMKMIAPYGNMLKDISILEPSAGKGDILDYMRNYFVSRYENIKLYCIEQNKDLQYILSEKGYRVIGEDFLEYSGDYYFDLILMNPPFSNGVHHLLKAWEILQEGEICCLLNAETIRNPYSEHRKLLWDIISKNGSVEFLGDCFSTAVRKTGVEVAMVRLTKKCNGGELNFDFQQVTKEEGMHIDENTLKNPIATRDVVGNMMLQYDKLKEAYVEYMKVTEELSFYSDGLFTQNSGPQKIITEIKEEMRHASNRRGEGAAKLATKKMQYNIFCDKVKGEIWKVVIDKMGMERYMTNNVRKNFAKFTETQGAMDFTKENVSNLVRTLLLNGNAILDQAVTDVFDMFTAYHEDNRCYVEGWKTNSKWKANKKVILPHFVSMGYSGYYEMNYHYWDEYSDIERAMCYLSGKKYEDFKEAVGVYGYNTKDRDKVFKMESLEHAISKVNVGDFGLHTSEFFNFRCYKKGTLHIYFKDEWLWEEFNMRACNGKNWLPENEKKEWEEKKKAAGLVA